MLRIPSGYAIARLTRDGERCVYIQAALVAFPCQNHVTSLFVRLSRSKRHQTLFAASSLQYLYTHIAINTITIAHHVFRTC